MRCPPWSSVSSTTAGCPARPGAPARPVRAPARPSPACGSQPAPAPRRSRSQFAAPAASAPVTPSSRTAARETCQPDGPTAASRPLPSGPPANAASAPVTHPAAAPDANPHSGAASGRGVGMIRIVTTPPNTPARYGAASTVTASQAGTPALGPVGRAASIGNAGSAPSADPVGATMVPAPNAKPGPSAYATAQMTAFGR